MNLSDLNIEKIGAFYRLLEYSNRFQTPPSRKYGGDSRVEVYWEDFKKWENNHFLNFNEDILPVLLDLEKWNILTSYGIFPTDGEPHPNGDIFYKKGDGIYFHVDFFKIEFLYKYLFYNNRGELSFLYKEKYSLLTELIRQYESINKGFDSLYSMNITNKIRHETLFIPYIIYLGYESDTKQLKETLGVSFEADIKIKEVSNNSVSFETGEIINQLTPSQTEIFQSFQKTTSKSGRIDLSYSRISVSDESLTKLLTRLNKKSNHIKIKKVRGKNLWYLSRT